jgi:hypothetical protein
VSPCGACSPGGGCAGARDIWARRTGTVFA